MNYYSIPHKAFTLWTGPYSQAGKLVFPGKPPIPSLLPKRSKKAGEFKSAVHSILSGIESYETENGYHLAWRRIRALREHFNLSYHYHSWASGYLDCTTARWYREKVVFLYIMPDGTLVEYKHATEEQKSRIHGFSQATPENSGHFWIKSRRAFN